MNRSVDFDGRNQKFSLKGGMITPDGAKTPWDRSRDYDDQLDELDDDMSSVTNSADIT